MKYSVETADAYVEIDAATFAVSDEGMLVFYRGTVGDQPIACWNTAEWISVAPQEARE